MQFTGFKINVIENNIKQAQYKLSQHKNLGEKSNLSIVQVARLMDKLTLKQNSTKEDFSFSIN